MTAYLDRDSARQALIEMGAPVGKSALANMASDDTGPEYVRINGRALYTRETLIQWVADQAAKPVVRLSTPTVTPSRRPRLSAGKRTSPKRSSRKQQAART